MALSLQHLTFICLFSLCSGYFLSFALIRSKELSQRYYLYHGLGTLALNLCAYFILWKNVYQATYVTAYDELLSSFAITYTLICFGMFFFSILANKSNFIKWLSFLVVLIGSLWILYLDTKLIYPNGKPPFDHFAYFWLNTILSMFLLGLTMAAMLLGHWYLIQPKLPIEELKRTTGLMIVVIIIRFIHCSTLSIMILKGMNEAEIYKYLLSQTTGIFLMMRWGWGILGPLALSYFIWQTLKIRSTQSATGILYVGVMFVLAGEIISLYLTFFHGMPL